MIEFTERRKAHFKPARNDPTGGHLPPAKVGPLSSDRHKLGFRRTLTAKGVTRKHSEKAA